MEGWLNSYTATQSASGSLSQAAIEWVECSQPPHTSITIVSSYLIGLNERVMQLLNGFASLEDNWDSDGALSPDKLALERAKNLTRALNNYGQKVFHSAPGPNGEVMLDLRSSHSSKSLEIIFYPNRAVAVLFSPDTNASQHNFNFLALPGLLEWLNN